MIDDDDLDAPEPADPGEPIERGDDSRLPSEPEPDDSFGGTSRTLRAQPSLPSLVGSGFRALRRFPRLVAALYGVQLALSLVVGLVMARLLEEAFAHRPLFDRAMEGDAAALITSFGSPAGAQLLSSLMWLAVPVLVAYGVVSWFTTAGLLAVLLDPPRTRREVARWFGASGVSNFFSFARLWLWSLIPLAVVLVAAAMGMGASGPRFARALDLGDTAIAAGIGLGPALLLYWLLATSIDYARVDLVRHPGMSAVRALVRGFRLAFKRRLAMAHTGLYGLVFAGITAGYLGLTGAGIVTGVAGLVALRQLVAILRFGAHVGLVAGQVELGCSAMEPPLGRRRL